jgi:Restriction endonuclease
MLPPKGAALEELVRAYFTRQGFLAVRGVLIRFEDEEVTDVDVWLYGRKGAGTRTRAIVDVKDKRSPRAFERVLWARGMQLALGCDRAIVATTDDSPKVVRFAAQQKVALLPADGLRRSKPEGEIPNRLTMEEFIANIQRYPNQKQDGDWIRRIADAKSAVVSLPPFPAFNKAMSSFRFFAERSVTRSQHREQALRGAFLCAALACIALDSAMERLFFEDPQTRFRMLASGITYGDAGDGRVQGSIDTVLTVIAKGVRNGQVIARQATEALGELLGSVRADMIAEFFAKEQNAGILFSVARELDARAHMRERTDIVALGLEAKSVIGLFADFIEVKRPSLLSSEFVGELSPTQWQQAAEQTPPETSTQETSLGETDDQDGAGEPPPPEIEDSTKLL